MYFEDEVLDEFAVIAGQVVLGDQQNLAGVGDGFRQRHLRRVPVPPAEEGEVLALLERHEVVREPDLLGADVTVEVLTNDRVEFEHQCVSYGFNCHKSNCNPRTQFS